MTGVFRPSITSHVMTHCMLVHLHSAMLLCTLRTLTGADPKAFGQTAIITGYQGSKSSPQIHSDLAGSQMGSAHAVGQWVWDEAALELGQRSQLYLDPSKVHTPPALHSAAHSVMQVSE